LIPRRVIKIVATRCHILRLKCTKFDSGWGSAPDSARGVYSGQPDPNLDLRGLLLSAGSERREGEERGDIGMDRDPPQYFSFVDAYVRNETACLLKTTLTKL